MVSNRRTTLALLIPASDINRTAARLAATKAHWTAVAARSRPPGCSAVVWGSRTGVVVIIGTGLDCVGEGSGGASGGAEQGGQHDGIDEFVDECRIRRSLA